MYASPNWTSTWNKQIGLACFTACRRPGLPNPPLRQWPVPPMQCHPQRAEAIKADVLVHLPGSPGDSACPLAERWRDGRKGVIRDSSLLEALGCSRHFHRRGLAWKTMGDEAVMSWE